MCENNLPPPQYPPQFVEATDRLRDYVRNNRTARDWETANALGLLAVAAIVGGGLLGLNSKLLKDITFESSNPGSKDLSVLFTLRQTEDPEHSPPVNLFPYLGSAISVSLDNGTVLKTGIAPKSADGVKAANKEVDGALFMAAAVLTEVIDSGITGVTGWDTGLPGGASQSSVTANCVIEITVAANIARLAEVLVDMTSVLEKQTYVI